MATVLSVKPANQFGNKVRIFKFVWVADGAGAVTSATTVEEVHGYIVKLRTDPGNPNPTAGYSTTLSDDDGCDTLGGAGAGRAAATPEQFMPLVGAGYFPCRVDSVLTFAVTGNIVANAVGEFYAYVEVD